MPFSQSCSTLGGWHAPTAHRGGSGEWRLSHSLPLESCHFIAHPYSLCYLKNCENCLFLSDAIFQQFCPKELFSTLHKSVRWDLGWVSVRVTRRWLHHQVRFMFRANVLPVNKTNTHVCTRTWKYDLCQVAPARFNVHHACDEVRVIPSVLTKLE